MRNHLKTALVALALAAQAACSDSQTPEAVEGPEPAPDPVAGPPRMTCPDSGLAGRILVDASRDGGVWWSPQAGTFDPGAAHQGEQLAAYLRGRGFIVDELPRGRIVSDTLLSTYQGVIRAGQYGSYTAGELEGYDWFLDCGRTLILLGEFLQDGGRDGLAEHLGIPLRGRVTGVVTSFGEHPITQDVDFLGFNMGSMILEPVPTGITVLGRLDSGEAVMGLFAHPKSRVFFLGDVNEVELVPQPLVDNLIRWGFE